MLITRPPFNRLFTSMEMGVLPSQHPNHGINGRAQPSRYLEGEKVKNQTALYI